jgi:hypothetical protein
MINYFFWEKIKVTEIGTYTSFCTIIHQLQYYEYNQYMHSIQHQVHLHNKSSLLFQ